ncbi:MAG: PilC/PilY family type IV pilus protein [Pseudomonadota bacterium]|nr:PilC/PilY family type IV pilus protein [Pseudomonadota bacterium]
MPRHARPHFQKKRIAVATAAALAPALLSSAWALSLAQSPPGTVKPYVAPNVILSLDDSGSMSWAVGGAGTPIRREVLRNAVTDVFNDHTLLPDGKIRLAWQAMHNAVTNPAHQPLLLNSASNLRNGMRSLEGTHRANLLAYMAAYGASGGTPTHNLMQRADNYMRGALNINSPWAFKPGVQATPYLACRRNYHIVLTDGGWNGTMLPTPGSPNFDGTSRTLPDGAIYDTSSPQTQIYRDTEGTTIADWAMYSWAQPLQNPASLTGAMVPSTEYLQAPATETFTNQSTGASVTLDRYWNPRYNPATWPHMVTYTIGFSNDALPKANYNPTSGARIWTPAFLSPTTMVPYGYDGNFADYANGLYRWRAIGTGAWNNLNGNDKGHDMWHAAINGRGGFYAVTKAEDLKEAFRAIIGNINSAVDPNLSSSAASGSNVSRNEVGMFTSSYDPTATGKWSGDVTARTVRPDGSTVPSPGWGGQGTAAKLDALGSVNSRVVLTWNTHLQADGKETGGTAFRWTTGTANLSIQQKDWIKTGLTGATADTVGGQRLEFIRGDRSREGTTFRERGSRQGDIVNSGVWYTGAPVSNYALNGYAAFTRNNKNRPPMIYVGGNDGMLHGFSATDGSEKLAYVPRGAIYNLHHLTAVGYENNHRAFVDGSPMTGDVDLGPGVQDPSAPGYGPADWRTFLVGTMGAGGKGYFVLDVTNPGNAPGSTAPSFEEAKAQNLVRLDRTRGQGEPDPDCVTGLTATQSAVCTQAVDEDKDIGHITAAPVLDENNGLRTSQITRMSNNRWAVVMGNGYNSTNQRPVLLIQYLDGAQELRRIPVTADAPGTGNATDNGLGAPRVVDLNGDGRVDVAYAGDNLGNMWKFDLTSSNPTQWKVAFSGAPLFTARGPASLGSALRNKVQPISAPPTVRANDRMRTGAGGTGLQAVGGMMVAFGTGRNVSMTDPTNVDVQTLYSVLDNTRYRTTGSGDSERLEVHPGAGTCPGTNCVPAPAALGTGVTVAQLAEQKISNVGSDWGRISPADASQELKPSTWGTFNGWYLDFPAVGERLLKAMEYYDGSNLLAVYSQVPAKGSYGAASVNVESCDTTTVDAERQFLTLVNIMDGKRPSVQVMDMNGDGVYTPADGGVSRKEVDAGAHTLLAQGAKMVDVSVRDNKLNMARLPEESLRPSWRQLR